MHSNAITICVLKVLFITWNLTKTNFLSKFKNDAMWTNISIFYFLRYNPFFPSAPQSVGCWAESSSCTLPIKAKSKWWAMRCQRLLVVRWWGAVVLWRDGAMLRWCGGAVVRWCGGTPLTLTNPTTSATNELVLAYLLYFVPLPWFVVVG